MSPCAPKTYSTTLRELLDGFVKPASDDAQISGMTVDSRQVRPGDLFVALSGTRSHGLNYVLQAVKQGCHAVAWETSASAPTERLKDLQIPHPGIPFLSQNLGEMASRFYHHPSQEMQVIGVTGTNGKTSCVDFLSRSVSDAGKRCGTVGTLGIGIVGDKQTFEPSTLTTPDAASLQRTLANFRDWGAEVVAMEVSSHALEQGRVNGVGFDAAVFTNLTRDHLDFHGSMQAYQRAKARLFARDGLRFAILNGDDPACRNFEKAVVPGAEIIRYGLNGGDVKAENVEYRPDGVAFSLTAGQKSGQVDSQLIGRFNVYNLLAVAATLLALGWRMERVVSHLSRLLPPAGRMNNYGGVGQPLVVVDYAHTPDALKNALEEIRRHTAGRIVCAFGCGGERDSGKRAEMGRIAEALADAVIVTDDNPRNEDGDLIVTDILVGMTRPGMVQIIRDRALAIAAAIQTAGPGDVVLIAGKGHEHYQDAGGVRRPFCDAEQAMRALEERS